MAEESDISGELSCLLLKNDFAVLRVVQMEGRNVMLVLAFPFAGAFGSRGVLASGGAGRFDGGLAVDGQLLRKRFVRLYSEY